MLLVRPVDGPARGYYWPPNHVHRPYQLLPVPRQNTRNFSGARRHGQ